METAVNVVLLRQNLPGIGLERGLGAAARAGYVVCAQGVELAQSSARQFPEAVSPPGGVRRATLNEVHVQEAVRMSRTITWRGLTQRPAFAVILEQ